MRIRRKIVLFLLLLVCFIVQGTFLKVIAIGSISPNLILIFVVSFGFMRGKKTGIWTGFVCGLCCELRVPVLIVAVCDLVYGGMVYVLGFLLHGRIQFFYYFSRMMIPEMIYTVLLTAILYKVFLKINKKLTELEMKERDSIWLRK